MKEHQEGPKANSQKDLAFNLNLSEIVMSGSSKEADQDEPEDRFILNALQPETKSSLINNWYRFRWEPLFKGCFCCDKNEKTEGTCELDVSILPDVNPACIGFIPPEGFAPFNLACTSFQVSNNSF